MSSFPQIDPSGSDSEPHSTSLWKDEVAERLAAHRARRGGHASISDSPKSDCHGALCAPPPDANRAARIAAAIADRYSRQPSYRELLAQQEAEEKARAAAEAIEAAAANAARAEPAPDCATVQQPLIHPPQQPATELDPRPRYIETSHRVVLHAPMPAPLPHQAISRAATVPEEDVRQEIEDLLNSVLVEPTVPLPAKLIEFPRELVAPRKARPRIAEGPLLQEAASNPAGEPPAQLRIFEVQNETISHDPVFRAAAASDAPVWSSIRLDDPIAPRWREETPSSLFALPLQPASLSRRALAGAIDLACVAAAFIGFETVFFFSTTHPPQAKLGAEFAAGVFVLLLALYQLMFFTFAESTPGMRAARIALCTFDDTNPTRRAMRLRLGAILLAACPLGLGLFWAIIDEDGLGWHDRIARMYQRSY